MTRGVDLGFLLLIAVLITKKNKYRLIDVACFSGDASI